jgi:hypothetical protein
MATTLYLYKNLFIGECLAVCDLWFRSIAWNLICSLFFWTSCVVFVIVCCWLLEGRIVIFRVLFAVNVCNVRFQLLRFFFGGKAKNADSLFDLQRESLSPCSGGGKKGMLSSSLSPEELAFVAEDSLTFIVPTVPMEPLELLSGQVGPLIPQVPAEGWFSFACF